MRSKPTTLDYASFDEHLNDLARQALLGHELSHVVQQASSSAVGRRRLLHRLQDSDPQIWFALTSGRPLTEREAEKVGRHLASSL